MVFLCCKRHDLFSQCTLVKQGMIYYMYVALAMAFGGVQYTLYNLFCEMN